MVFTEISFLGEYVLGTKKWGQVSSLVPVTGVVAKFPKANGGEL